MKRITWIMPFIYLASYSAFASYQINNHMIENDIDLHIQSINNVTSNSVSATLFEDESPFYHFNANGIGALAKYHMVTSLYFGESLEQCNGSNPVETAQNLSALTAIGTKTLTFQELASNTGYCLVSMISYTYLSDDGQTVNTTTRYAEVIHTQTNKPTSNKQHIPTPADERFLEAILESDISAELFHCGIDDSYWFIHYQWPNYVARCTAKGIDVTLIENTNNTPADLRFRYSNRLKYTQNH
ncbi:hypothetical protein KP803_15565 [Vibrio sp. ZSDE26]|uniref:Toxin co-regulated pilus biosynthesis protein Q C-terminal domain-containing protein n=1 Tax=Vibrio amylolyticus TaxID=2847292 RepID=A0A9X2BKM0_9VIBR|nr:hypothetical protein [Vibrio amylolyticus]MCK6264697.1 hypothetical protein [Vibrio amylolyticus]